MNKRNGFHYRPKDKWPIINLVGGHIKAETPQEVIDYCLDVLYKGIVHAANQEKKDETSNTTDND